MSTFRSCRHRGPIAAVRVAVLLVVALSVTLWALPPAARVGLTPSPAGAAATATPRRYIVLLRPQADAGAVARDHSRRFGAKITSVYPRVRGYAALLTSSRAAALAGDRRVQAVEPDGPVRLRAVEPGGSTPPPPRPQSQPPWNLDRLDQASPILDGVYRSPDDGAGVTAYVIDTGIRFTHRELGGRAESGFDAVDGGAADDCNGHGTHVAGTIGGRTSGVAKAVRLVAVRVLDCRGAGSTAAVIAGIDWVTANHRPGTPAVANLSLGGPASAVIDQAVQRSSDSGVTYVVAAGNDGGDACLQSPARVPAAITVGASDRSDHRPSWSSTGRCVDVYAPGAGIRSAWFTGDDDMRDLDGTSMASPHVAGAAAVYLQLYPGATPKAVAAGLRAWALPGVVTGSAGGGGDLLQLGPRSR